VTTKYHVPLASPETVYVRAAAFAIVVEREYVP
jgi:hypothetical protein